MASRIKRFISSQFKPKWSMRKEFNISTDTDEGADERECIGKVAATLINEGETVLLANGTCLVILGFWHDRTSMPTKPLLVLVESQSNMESPTTRFRMQAFERRQKRREGPLKQSLSFCSTYFKTRFPLFDIL